MATRLRPNHPLGSCSLPAAETVLYTLPIIIQLHQPRIALVTRNIFHSSGHLAS